MTGFVRSNGLYKVNGRFYQAFIDLLRPVFSWGNAHVFFENGTEKSIIRIADLLADLGDRGIFIGQERRRVIDPRPNQKLPQGIAAMLGKDPAEIGR